LLYCINLSLQAPLEIFFVSVMRWFVDMSNLQNFRLEWKSPSVLQFTGCHCDDKSKKHVLGKESSMHGRDEILVEV